MLSPFLFGYNNFKIDKEMEGKKSWIKVFKRIKFAKKSPWGLLDGMEVWMYYPGEIPGIYSELPEEDYINLDTNLLFKFLKQHVLNEPNQICFPRTCWKLYRILK